MASPPPPRSRPARTPGRSAVSARRATCRRGRPPRTPPTFATPDISTPRPISPATASLLRNFRRTQDRAGPPCSRPRRPPPLQRQRHRASRRRHNPRWPRDRAKPALPPPLPTRARDHPAPCNRDYDFTRPGTLVTTSAGSTPARVELALPSTLPARQRARHPRHNISRLHARSGRARAPVYNDCTKPGTLVTTSPGSTPARAEPALPSTLPARQCACTLPVRPRPRPHRRLHGSPAQPIASHEAPPAFPPSRSRAGARP